MRSESARTSVLSAASSLIERYGYDRVSIEGIAAEAGVSKQTIYRWWPSKSAVVAECLLEGALLPDTYAPHDTGDLAADLTEWLQRVYAFLAVPAHELLVRSLIGAAVDNPQVGERLSQRLGASPDILHERLQAAVDRAQLRPGTSVETVANALVGVILARILLAPATADAPPEVVDLILHGAKR